MPATFTISRRSLSIALTITLPAAATCVAALGSLSQHSATTESAAPYRAPTIALVQPAAGGAIPQDRPVVVLRFLPGEPGDPIDAASFAVALDGEDRTAGFHVSATEGWGSLATRTRDSVLTLGSHSLEARICSVRGACATTATAIVVHRGVGRRVR